MEFIQKEINEEVNIIHKEHPYFQYNSKGQGNIPLPFEQSQPISIILGGNFSVNSRSSVAFK